MIDKQASPGHTALIIPDGRTRIYNRDIELSECSEHDTIEVPAKDAFLGRMSSLSRQYAERFYPNNWFILSTNSNKNQRWLVHPDKPINGEFDNPPYPIPDKNFEGSEKPKYWQPFLKKGVLKHRLIEDAEDLGLLPKKNGATEKQYTRVIFLGNWTDAEWWSQTKWDSWIKSKKFDSWLKTYKENKIKTDPCIYTPYDSHRYQYSLYVDVIKALFKNKGIWVEFPLLDCPTESKMVSRISDAIYRGFPLHRSPYALKKITVNNLFRMDNPDFTYHDLPLGNPSNIQIISAPNGYGKSTIFRLIRAIFRGNLKEIASIPFNKAEITLNDEEQSSVLRVEKTYSDKTQKETGFIISYDEGNRKIPISIPISNEDLDHRADDQIWKNKLVKKLGEVIPPITIRFLSSERLFHDPLRKIYSSDLLTEHNEVMFKENISRATQYAQSLSKRIDGVLTDYATTSHKIDTTFPVELARQHHSSSGQENSSGYDEISKSFSKLKEKRRELEKIDFLPFRKWYPEEVDPFESKNLPQSINYHDFLNSYLKAQESKYAVFDWLNTRCQMFEKIINNLLVFTRIRIRRDRRDIGFSFYNLYEGSGRYHEIDLDQISSGEMHQVVMYYDFLFNCDPGTVVLIDEPEISLHVYAQSLFIDNIRKIADKKLNNLQFIVATHSPTIIGEHWDVTYDLLTGAYNE